MTEPGEPVEVLSGRGRRLRWVVVTSGTDEDLYTMLNVYSGDQLLAGAEFGGPKLYPGSVMNEWRGQRDDLPWFVMARTDPVVDRVVATTAGGTNVVLAMSPLVAQFGLRFAAAALRPGAARRVAGRTPRVGAGKPAARRAAAPPAGTGRLNRMLIEHRARPRTSTPAPTWHPPRSCAGRSASGRTPGSCLARC